MTPSPRSWTTILLVLLASPLTADEVSDAWSEGRSAFASGDYAAALDAFERAKSGNQSGPAVYYNIGVSQYRLQDYAAARRTFTLLDKRFPAMRPLAQYNLGLVALKLGRADVARRHFRSSYLLAGDDPKLRALASTQLRRLVDDSEPAAEWLRASRHVPVTTTT
ncbi:MAG: tetratricopeptide repeat protein [Woeseiaceae bacterium]|nr:tetratricopeptide repeat protein [Woeseiaceae bacterium]